MKCENDYFLNLANRMTTMRDIKTILNDYKDNKITLEEAKQELSLFSLEFIEDGVNLDLGMDLRKGIPEVIYAE